MLGGNYCKEVISGGAGATTISKLVALLPPFSLTHVEVTFSKMNFFPTFFFHFLSQWLQYYKMSKVEGC